MSDDITAKRHKVEALEAELQSKRQELNELRRSIPREEVKDYEFTGSDGRACKLSDLFGDKSDLIIIHNMGKSCPYCTLWADGFEGFRQHLEDRAGFALVSPNSPDEVREFAEGRNWKFRTLSGAGSSFTKDMGYESDKGAPQPGISTFVRTTNGRIERVATASFGPGDDFCSIWHMFDLLADGANDWGPKYNYD